MGHQMEHKYTLDFEVLNVENIEDPHNCLMTLRVKISTFNKVRVKTGIWPWSSEKRWELASSETKVESLLRSDRGQWFRSEEGGEMTSGNWEYNTVREEGYLSYVRRDLSAILYERHLEDKWTSLRAAWKWARHNSDGEV